ncbi:hypothetical protein PUN28_017178 [Cardiocondyla obscurior]|uniref:Uncharacterized protein n=1 Tax=Cardiocondyla obscurior TaxID=286306 RepID=A0AAW2EMS4_9HYME
MIARTRRHAPISIPSIHKSGPLCCVRLPSLLTSEYDRKKKKKERERERDARVSRLQRKKEGGADSPCLHGLSGRKRDRETGDPKGEGGGEGSSGARGNK